MEDYTKKKQLFWERGQFIVERYKEYFMDKTLDDFCWFNEIQPPDLIKKIDVPENINEEIRVLYNEIFS